MNFNRRSTYSEVHREEVGLHKEHTPYLENLQALFFCRIWKTKEKTACSLVNQSTHPPTQFACSHNFLVFGSNCKQIYLEISPILFN